MFEPIEAVVWARSAVCGTPDVGARDQYMPEAGAGNTSDADFASGGGGKYVCWPIFLDWSGFGAASGVEVLLSGLPAIAEVDRKTTGRRSSLTDKVAGAAGGASCLFELAAGPLLSLICVGTFGTGPVTPGRLVECEWDCERERASLLTLPLRFSVLLLDIWPGV